VLTVIATVLLVLVVLAFASFLGRCIHGAEEPIAPPAEPETPADLDDWLASVGPLKDFNIWKRPVASTKSARVADTTGHPPHGGTP